MAKILGRNDRGYLVGESHPSAKLSDREVDMIREMREDKGMSLYKIAKKFSVPVKTIHEICKYRRRAQTPVRFTKKKSSEEE